MDDTHEQLIGSVIRCLDKYTSDFLQYAPDCVHHEAVMSRCTHDDNPQVNCGWRQCPLR